MSDYTSALKIHIRAILKSADLVDEYIDLLTDDKSMLEFTKAFTHTSIDPIQNYEFYEILGDATTNKVVVWYFVRRFPQIFDEALGKKGNMGPVAIMARLKQNGVSKKTYAQFSHSLGFWNFIKRHSDEDKNKTKLMEDVFESFCGCLELLVDTRIDNHVGYSVIYVIMKALMDKINVSLDRSDLYDAKTRLNEKISETPRRFKLEYNSTINEAYNEGDPSSFNTRFKINLVIVDSTTNKRYTSRFCIAANKKIAEQDCAESVLSSKLIEKIVSGEVR